MTWAGRARLFGGMLAVLLVVAACTLVFTQRQQRAVSTTAAITAEEYPVGTDYGGIVTQQYVHEGDTVVAGEPLFRVQSLRLQQDIASGQVSTASSAYPVSSDGTATVLASVAGTVSSVDVQQGAYAQAGAVLAKIDRSGSLAVTAQYSLTAGDYGRIAGGATVDILLPDGRTVSGRVERVDVTTVAGRAQSSILVDSSALNGSPEAEGGTRFSAGTPVSATLHLRDDGILAGPTDAFAAFLRKIGL